MKFWTTAPEAYDYDFTVDTEIRSGLKLGHIYRLVEITDPNRVEYQRERYRSGLYPSFPFESLQQELP